MVGFKILQEDDALKSRKCNIFSSIHKCALLDRNYFVRTSDCLKCITEYL